MLYLVTAYSLSPLWRLVAEKVPIHPRNRLSFPSFQVTNSGLKWNNNGKIILGLKFSLSCHQVLDNLVYATVKQWCKSNVLKHPKICQRLAVSKKTLYLENQRSDMFNCGICWVYFFIIKQCPSPFLLHYWIFLSPVCHCLFCPSG